MLYTCAVGFAYLFNSIVLSDGQMVGTKTAALHTDSSVTRGDAARQTPHHHRASDNQPNSNFKVRWRCLFIQNLLLVQNVFSLITVASSRKIIWHCCSQGASICFILFSSSYFIMIFYCSHAVECMTGV